jgi:Zn-dependent protease with chaperone function
MGMPLLIVLFLLVSLLGEKKVSIFPWVLLIVPIVIAGPFIGIFLASRKKRTPKSEEEERLKRVFASIGGDERHVCVDRSAFSEVAVTGSVGLGGKVTVSARALEILTDAELSVLLAHELAHVKSGHPLKRLIFVLVLMAPVFVLFLWRDELSPLIGRRIVLIAPFVFMVGLLIAMFTLIPRVRRRTERACDRWALEKTRDPVAMFGLWKKMWGQASGQEVFEDMVASHPSLLNRFKDLRANALELGLMTPELAKEIDDVIERAERED